MKSVNLDKIQSYIRDNVELYKGFYGFYSCNTDKYNTYFLTIIDKNYSSDTLKKFRPGLLKKLRSIGAKYFLSSEVGFNHAFHFHISIVVPNDINFERIIGKYLSNKSLVVNFPTVDIDIKEVKNIENYSSHYLIKMFNDEKFKSSDYDSEEFVSYINRLKKHIRLYSIFSFHI